MIKLFTALPALFLCFANAHAAPNEITITKPTDPKARIPISISGFSGEPANVLKFDLEIMGCEVVPAEKAQYRIEGNNAGQIEGILKDAITGQTLLANRYSGGTVRSQTHRFSDDIIFKLTGQRGIAQTKIAFKGQSNGRTEIYIADYDGANAIAVTSDNALVAAPAWVPGRMALYYTSYRSGYPDIYSHDLATGERRVIAKHPGLNTSVAISADGNRIAMILSKGGSPDVYVADANGGALKQLTFTKQDESSPTWSPDGRTLCFSSSSRGTPALYLVDVSGGQMRRLNAIGAGRSTEPAWSPDGRSIAFTVQRGGFEIYVVPAEGGEVRSLAVGEDPSWAPNSRNLIFTRTNSRGQRVLSLLDVPTGTVKDVATNLGRSTQPSWAQ